MNTNSLTFDVILFVYLYMAYGVQLFVFPE